MWSEIVTTRPTPVARRPNALADKRAEARRAIPLFLSVARRPKALADKRAEARRAIPLFFGGAGVSPASMVVVCVCARVCVRIPCRIYDVSFMLLAY